jgi:hypothetical protein
LKLAELLQILLKEVPECGEFMVSDHREWSFINFLLIQCIPKLESLNSIYCGLWA